MAEGAQALDRSAGEDRRGLSHGRSTRRAGGYFTVWLGEYSGFVVSDEEMVEKGLVEA